MTRWLLYLLGIDASRLPPHAGTELVWLHAPGSWALFLFLAVVLGVVWGVFQVYKRESGGCAPRQRAMLAALRAGVLVLLAILFLGPALAVFQRHVIQPSVLVLLDDSLSMSIKDRYGDAGEAAHVAAALNEDIPAVRASRLSRADLVNRLLARHGGAFLEDLARHGRVQVMTFSNRVNLVKSLPPQTGGAGAPTVQPVAQAAGGGPLVLKPTGPATNLGRAIRDALKSVAGNPVAGIVLVTDGQNTESDDPLAAADQAGAQKVPIFPIGVGDPTLPRNVRVADLWARDTVWRDDPFQLEAVIQGQGLGDQPLDLELVQQPADASGSAGAGQVVARRTVRLPAGQNQITTSFEYRPHETGRFVYTVRVAPLAGESSTQDNVSRPVTVNVVSQAARVLLISGVASWDYQDLKNLLLRDKSINLSCWLQSLDLDVAQDGRTVINHLPDTPADLFKYDVVLMLDPNPSPVYDPLELRPQWIDLLKSFVKDHGGGFLFAAGPRYTAQLLSYRLTSGLMDLLPVSFDSSQTLDVESLTTLHIRPWPMQLTPDGYDHPITRFDPDGAVNRRLWESLPGVYWSFPARMAKPGAHTLLQHTDPALRTSDGARPLLVSGQYGAGRTVYLGIDSTWRWRSVGHDSEYFDKFWIQTVRYLVEGRRLGGARRGVLATDNEVYTLGAPVHITARLYDQAFQPLKEPRVQAALAVGGRGPVAVDLHPVANRPGAYEASVLATHLGTNELSLVLPGEPGSAPVRLVRTFTVELPRIEFNDPRLNKPLLQEIARHSGGRYLDIDQAMTVPGLIPDRRETTIIRGEPIALWDSPTLLAILVGLLAAEWTLRKRNKLL